MKLCSTGLCRLVGGSPPARGRGLKLLARRMEAHGCMSPPARGRGLKPIIRKIKLYASCRPPHGGVD